MTATPGNPMHDLLPAPPTPLGYRKILSPTCGVRISPLCLGAMSLGQKSAALYGSITKEEAFDLLDEFVNAGGNYIDTACGYQLGDSEEWIGEWMELRGNRDQMVIATKYSSANDGTARDGNARGNSFKNMSVTIRDCLKRLRTDYVDVFYIHFWEYTTSVEEVMRGLNRLVYSGQILYPAVSDTPAWLVVKANDFARNNGLSPFVLYQGMFNLLRRDLEREVIPMCLDQGMGIAPWGVIGQGRFQTAAQVAAREKAGEMVRGGGQKDDDIRISGALEKIGGEVGASLTAVALAWSIQKYPYLTPIIGGRKIEHLRDNIKALTIDLTAAQVGELEAVIPFDFGFPFNFFGTDPRSSGGQETNLVLKGSHKILHVENPKTPKIPLA